MKLLRLLADNLRLQSPGFRLEFRLGQGAYSRAFRTPIPRESGQ
jgi:hypothetical protein